MTHDPVLNLLKRKVMPDLIARDIVGSQPRLKKWERVGKDGPSDRWVYSIHSQEIRDWVGEQPEHMWQHYYYTNINDLRDTSASVLFVRNYVFTEEMEVWFTLKWV